MKQKIIIKVSMNCSKCRTKAMKIAAVADGVTSVALHGPDKDKLLVLGDEVDVACLTHSLRKKLCYASLEIVEEVKPEDKKTPTAIILYSQPEVEYYRVIPDSSPGLCTIL